MAEKQKPSDVSQQIVQIAEALLPGQIGLIDGSRRLASLRHEVSEEPTDDDFSIFVLLDSDTDHLPIGEVRTLWSLEALKNKNEEMREIEDFYRLEIEEGCRILLRRFQGSK